MANGWGGEIFDGHESLVAAVPGQPEDREVFRLGQLLLLLQVAHQRQKAVPSIDRLGVYDFLAANPYVAVSASRTGTTRTDSRSRSQGLVDTSSHTLRLVLASYRDVDAFSMIFRC